MVRALAVASIASIASIACGPSSGAATDAGPDPCACPATPPASGVPCDRSTCGAAVECVYDECAGVGETTATCVTSRWQVATVACAPKACPAGSATSCAAGEICLDSQAGAEIFSCVLNPCGEGPIDERCACSVCGDGACQSVIGATVTCEECSSPQCP